MGITLRILFNLATSPYHSHKTRLIYMIQFINAAKSRGWNEDYIIYVYDREY